MALARALGIDGRNRHIEHGAAVAPGASVDAGASVTAGASVAAGADGLIIEIHHKPEEALCDGHQSLSPDEFSLLMSDLKKVAKAIGREIL